MSRVLGLDYGERRIGLALSDPLGIIAKPLICIDRKKTADYISQISKIVSEKNITSIVVGLPLTLKGHYSKQTEIVLAFIDQEVRWLILSRTNQRILLTSTVSMTSQRSC